MEWTGARYADTPTVRVDTFVGAPPERVWEIVSDIRLMPELSQELCSVEWLDGATGPEVGNAFLGRNKHEALGEWETTSYVIECTAPEVFAWAVTDVTNPSSIWRFTLRAEDGGTRLTQWTQMGPARSGLSRAIDRMPEKEQKIVFVRLRELEAGMIGTLAAIKERAEPS
ncbi:SRPBCC family protein [Pseudonocardia acaciae]|uniref:SRPBCC family protein n=1 Tax=Pseudonocardia acaciae TaxID=551276 RepID=UPI000490CD08|nr:SRPBCC family protein [Pseudonocardia acaciae]